MLPLHFESESLLGEILSTMSLPILFASRIPKAFPMYVGDATFFIDSAVHRDYKNLVSVPNTGNTDLRY